MTTVSIAMATYNGAKYLREQLESIAAQTRLPDELVVCDDASSDETVSILEDFAASAPFHVRIERNESNLGFAQNFGKALSLCTGDIVFLSDQDDWWLPEKIDTQLRYLEQHPACMVVMCDQEICDGELHRSGVTKLENIRGAGYSEASFITGCCMAIRQQFVSLALPVPEHERAHDTWIGRLSNAMQAKHVIDKPLQLYRRHGENTSQWIMSRPEKVTTLDIIKSQGLRPAHDIWHQETISIKLAIERLEDAGPAFMGGELASSFRTAITHLQTRATRLKRRIRIIAYPRIIRWPFVLAYWANGSYRQFSGWKSAAKDFVRP